MNCMSEDIDFIDLTSDLPGHAKAASVALAGAEHVEELVTMLRQLPPDGQIVLLVDSGHRLASRVAEFARVLARTDLQNERLVEAMFAVGSTASRAAAGQAQRNADARQELADEFELLDSEAVAKAAGSTAGNRSATASRWLAEKRIFAVEHLNARLYPGFQFGTNGRPRPVIKSTLEVFEPYALDGWETALWFTTATGWLDDQRPVDLLTKSPKQVVEAAQHAFEDVTA